MNIERVRVFGFDPAFSSMRHPKESWAKSDSFFYSTDRCSRPWPAHYAVPERPEIGPNDMQLACSLITAGRASHRKFLRLIWVWVDLRIPRNVWTELDTYKVATTRMSCSTMYKLGSRDLEPSDFQDEDVDAYTLRRLNRLGEQYRAASGKKKVALLVKLKRRLPEGFLQMATYNFNYETALAIYFDRANHRMPEWSDENGICAFIRSLPYMGHFIGALEAKHNKGKTT